MKNLSVKKKLYLMIIIIFLPLIVRQVIEIRSLTEKRIDLELKSNEDFAKAVSVTFTNYLERLWDTELSMGVAICNNSTHSNGEIGQYMKNILENQPTVREYGWIDAKTLKFTASSDPKAEEVSLAGREYIDRILNGEEKVVSDVIISRVYNEPTFIVARGIRKDGVLVGIIIANVEVSDLWKVLPSDRATEYGYFGLLDKQGIFVYRNEMHDVVLKMICVKENPNFVPALKGKTVRLNKYVSSVTGKTMIGVNLPIRNIGWVAYANTSYDEVMKKTFNDIRSDMLTLLFMIAIGIFVVIILEKQILRPINKLQASAVEMTNGNLSIRTNITGTDEIAMAAQAFDRMAASIEQYDTLKSQFFSNISHELKTPLNIILASLQMIESKNPVERACENNIFMAKYIPMMKQNCYRLLRLINNLIDISKIDSGFLNLNCGNYNIVSIVEDIALSVADFSESKGINLIFDTDTEEKIIGCDPDKIERIMLNLLSNSIKFTPTGGSIFVNITDRDTTISIRVKDTGIGIPADKIDIIFERFRQVDSSLQREYEGSGIGLSLVKALVEAHKGTIFVQSGEGLGTEITIELPTALIPEEDIVLKSTFDRQKMDKVQRINIEFSDIYKGI